MSFGFVVRDSQGKTIIDDKSFNYTAVGTGNTNSFGTPSGWTGPNIRGPIPKNDDEMIFYDFPVGKILFAGRGNPFDPGVYATENTNFIKARPYFTQSLPNYGIAVFDPSGVPTFHTGTSLIVTPNTHNQFVPRNQSPAPVDITIDQNTTHIAFVSSVKNLTAISLPNVIIVGLAVERTSATNARLRNFGLGSGPFNTTPQYPVNASFVTARFIP